MLLVVVTRHSSGWWKRSPSFSHSITSLKLCISLVPLIKLPECHHPSLPPTQRPPHLCACMCCVTEKCTNEDRRRHTRASSTWAFNYPCPDDCKADSFDSVSYYLETAHLHCMRHFAQGQKNTDWPLDRAECYWSSLRPPCGWHLPAEWHQHHSTKWVIPGHSRLVCMHESCNSASDLNHWH